MPIKNVAPNHFATTGNAPTDQPGNSAAASRLAGISSVGRPEPDGRRRRSQDSRRRIVEAMIELVREGDLAPSAEAVAIRAGVGRRTVFRLFSDMEGIFREIHLIMRDKVEPVRNMPLQGDTAEARLHALVERRVLFFEEILWVSAAAIIHRHGSPVLQSDHAMIQKELRNIMRDVLPSALAADRELCEALDAVMSIDMWRRLRIEQKLDTTAAAAIVHRLVSSLAASTE
jgi:AcrR family transcriptional regulator